MKTFYKQIFSLLMSSLLGLNLTVAQVPSYVPPNGLAGWWSFSGNANDASSYNAHGTVHGATLTTDRHGNPNSAYTFDGVDDYILIGDPVPTHLKIQNEFTLSAWIFATQYPTISNEYLGLIVGSQCDVCAYRGATIFLDGRINTDGQTNPQGHIHFQIGNGSNWGTSNSQSQVPLNQWVHITATRKAGEPGKIYYNGVLQPVASAPWNGVINYANAFFAIGKQKDRTRFFKGIIDDVGVWSRALEACEIEQLYNGVNQYPEIQCSYNQTRNADQGFCTYTAVGNEFDATFIDDCPATVTIYNNLNGQNTLAGYEFSEGTTSIVWYLIDGNGLTAGCSQMVTVIPPDSPGTLSGGTIVCSLTDSTELVLTGYTGTITEWQYSVNNGNTWNSIAHTSDTLTVTNISQTTWYRVKIESLYCGFLYSNDQHVATDYELPIISCPSDQIRFADTTFSVCGYNVIGSEFDAVFSDNCTGAYVTNSFNGLNTLNGAIFPINLTSVVWYVYDSKGNMAACSFNVTVTDNSNPYIIAPPDIIVFGDSGLCSSSQVVLGDLIGYDNCGILYVNNDTPALFPFGTTIVTWTAGDVNGNVSTVQQSVTVVDNQPPVPSEPSLPDIIAQCSVSSLIAPLALDNCAGFIEGTHEISLPVTAKGTTNITWSFDDGNGNIATANQNIIIADVTAPTFTCPVNVEICEGYSGINIAPDNISDNCSSSIQVTYKLSGATTGAGNNDASFESFNVGTTNVSYFYDDGDGNIDSCLVIVKVNPNYIITENHFFCEGSSYTWRGKNYSAPGIFYDSLQTNEGCDSIYILHLETQQCEGIFCDWQHYRKIKVNNLQNSETHIDYSVLIIVNTASLITQGKVKPDGSDIRFTTNFLNDLDYWIEPGIQNEHGMNDDSTHIWVKIPFIPATSSQNLYLLYGNPNATERSNISTTFLFGDDFNDNSIDTSKWNKYINGIGQIIEQNQRLEHNSPKSYPESGTEIFSKQSFTGPVVVDMQFKKGGHLYRGAGLKVENNQDTYRAWIGWQDWGGFGPSVAVNSVTQSIDFRNDSWSRYNNPEYYLHIYRKPDSTFRFVANVPQFEQDGYKYWEHTFTTSKMSLNQPLKIGAFEWVWRYAGTTWIRYEDNIRIRKYTEPEPFCELLDEYTVNPPANITYDTLCEGDSIFWKDNYYFTTGTYTDSLLSITGCDSVLVLNLTVIQPLIPVFGAMSDLCAGDPVNPLPAFSENGIEGTWSPAFDNTQTTMYVFTPQPGQCAVSTELSVTVIHQSEGGILSGPYNEICTGESIGLLSISNYIGDIIRWERSDNGGVSWMNLGNNSGTYMEIPGVPGTRMYRVVVQNNPCDIAYSNIHTIIIHPVILPLFDAISPVCSGDYMSPLPVVSNNGITGTWSPFPNNMQTTIYTFAPDPGQCAVNTQITIEVNPVYLFETDIELCSGNACFWRGNSYNQSGVYYDSLLTQYGCDSIYFLTLSYKNLPLDINNSTPILFSERISDANTIVLDHMNYTTTGQLYGALSYVQSVPGLSVAGNFSSGQWIRYGYNANLRDAGTFDMWIYPTAYSTPLANINYSNTATTYPGGGHVFHLDLNASGKIVMSNWPGTGLSTLESNSVIPLNQWSHVAVAWGDSTIIYINGKIDNSNPGSFRPSAYGNYSIRIPKWGSPYPVYIDEIHVSTKRRTLDEIRNGYVYYKVISENQAVCPGNSTNILITNSQSGIQYSLLKNDTLTGQTQTGNSNMLTFTTGPLYQASFFKIKAEDTLTGCSIFLDTTITITINETYENYEYAEICSWQTYVWQGQSLNAPGTYYENHTTVNGCDSIYVLYLSHRTPVPEICNGIDDDCDGAIDEGVQNIYYTDNDGDGYGTGAPIFGCIQPANTSTNNTDCDDTDFSKHEGIVIYLDSDNDGYHVAPEITICMGDQIPPGYKLYTLGIDCNDQNPNVNPGATEICNGLDDDCDGAVDEDLLGPPCAKQAGVCAGSRKSICGGAAGWLECNNEDYEAHNPNYEISETSCDGLDNDCDMYKDEGFSDNDGDGMADCVDPDDDNDGVLDYMDNCPWTPNPNQSDYDLDGIGDACDTDDDNDGYADSQDCAPLNPLINPGAQEICGNGIDDNCNGQIDECYTLTVSKQGAGSGSVVSNPAGIQCGSSCSYSYPPGTVVSVEAIPDAVSEFAGWNAACSGTGLCQIIMNGNRQIGAVFSKKYFNVSVTKTGTGNGTVTSTPAGINCGTVCSANYEAGSMIYLHASTDGNTVFTGWGGDAASCGTSLTCQLYVYSNINVTSSFECLMPAAAGTVSGPAKVCPDGSIYTFSVPPITHATSYVWNLPPGCIGSSTTNSINIIFTDTAQSGIISVYGQNACATGETSSLHVNVIGVEIEILNGSNQVCAGESVTIHANATGGTNFEYQWFVNDVPLTYGHTNKQNQVLFCPLDGNANDFSGNGINGIVHNAVPASDRFGNPGGALYFNGNSSWIDLRDHDSLNLHYGNISISAWTKKSVLNQHSRIYSKGTHCGTQPGYDLMFYGWGTPSRAACIFAAGGHEHIVYSNEAIADTNWHHYVGTIDRSGYVHLYVDGIKQNDSIFIGNHVQEDIALNTFNAAIGASYSYCGNPGMVNEFVNGSIDEVVLYKRVLSAAEVENLYHLQSTPVISFNPNDGDQLQCLANNSQMCMVESNFLLFNILSTPEMAGSISGPDTVFAGTSVIYTVPIIQHATSYLWTLPQGLSGSSSTNSIMAEVGTSSGSGIITVQGINTCGSGAVSEFPVEMIIPTKYLSLKVFLESLYNSQHQLNETKNNLYQPQWGSGIADILLIELFESNDLNTPYFSKDSVFLKTNGYTDIIKILNALPMEYYIVIKHRNSIETWSASPVSFSTTDTLFYDFTDSAAKTYLNNIQLVSGGFFAIYGGDVNQDAIVDGSDLSSVENAVNLFVTGYIDEDINGDGIVDGSDMVLIDNNSTYFVQRKKP